MSDINSEWVEKSAQALHDMRSRRSWAFHEIGQPLGDTVYDDERRADARAALEAVADDLRAEGAAKALESLLGRVPEIIRPHAGRPEFWAGYMNAVKSEAWDEGYTAGHEDARAVQPTYPQPTLNPYADEIEEERR